MALIGRKSRTSRWALAGLSALALFIGLPAAALADVGTITEYGDGLSAGAGVERIVAGPDGALWFTQFNANRIGRITLGGAITEFTGPSAGAGLDGIAAGADGNLWFAEVSGNRIGRITPSGSVTEFGAGLSAGSSPLDIAAGPDGALWFGEYSGNRIGRITTAGVITEFPLSGGGSPQSITAGPDGNLWFTESTGNRIGRITPTGTITEFGAGVSAASGLNGIAAGSDGNLWFTEQYGGRLGRITPAGAVTEFSDGLAAGSSPIAATRGPDGDVWFTDFSADRIGRIVVRVPTPPVVAPAPAPPPSRDISPPSLRGLAATLRPFHRAPARRSARHPHPAKVATSTRLSFTLSEPASVTATFVRRTPGRTKASSCIAPTARNRSLPRCTRDRTVARLTFAAPSGLSSRLLRARVGARMLAPGTYRVHLRATDAAQNTGTNKTTTLVILP